MEKFYPCTLVKKCSMCSSQLIPNECVYKLTLFKNQVLCALVAQCTFDKDEQLVSRQLCDIKKKCFEKMC